MCEFSSRYFCLLLLGLFLVSSQCRNVGFINNMINEKRAFKNIDYINMCMFRKTRLCDYLREIDQPRFLAPRKDHQIWKRGMHHFYSSW